MKIYVNKHSIKKMCYFKIFSYTGLALVVLLVVIFHFFYILDLREYIERETLNT